MKSLLKVGLLATLVIGGSAFANEYRTSSTNQSALFTSDAVASEAEAAQLANDYVASLQGMSAIELSHKLPTPHRRVDKRSVELSSTEVEVLSQEGADGSMEYVAQVLIDYSYDFRNQRSGSGGSSAAAAGVSSVPEAPAVTEPDTTEPDSTVDTDGPT